ncbi:MAG: GyrI-like domain-containing protein [Cyanobacteria bacterium RM1_2_2]|nr:GyrI-like domain-containing protein [Cyanobacteria bacterium RM1_2_2]
MESCRAGLEIVQPRRVQKTESYVMGIELCVANPTVSPLTAEVPKLWQRFAAEELLNIPDPVQPEVLYGIYTDYSECHPRQCSVIVAVEVSSIDNPPENMVGICIPAADYLVFEAISTSSNAVAQVWQQIESYFTENFHDQRAFTTDFEQYDQQQVKIYVAIKSV